VDSTIWMCLLTVFRLLVFRAATAVNSDKKPLWRQQTGSNFSKRFPVCRKWFFGDCFMSEAGPVGSDRLAHQGPLRKTTSGLLPPQWKTLGIYYPNVEQLQYIDRPQTRPKHRELLWNTSTCYDPPRLQKVENDSTNITWPICVISDYVNATIDTLWRDLGTYSNCARLLQSIPDTNISDGSKPEVVFQRGLPCVRRVSWVDSDSLRLAQSITVSFQDGGSKSEEVTLCTIVSFRLPQTCTMWISQKTGVSDKTRNYENCSYWLFTDWFWKAVGHVVAWGSSSPTWNVPVHGHEHLVIPQRIAPSSSI